MLIKIFGGRVGTEHGYKEKSINQKNRKCPSFFFHLLKQEFENMNKRKLGKRSP